MRRGGQFVLQQPSSRAADSSGKPNLVRVSHESARARENRLSGLHPPLLDQDAHYSSPTRLIAVLTVSFIKRNVLWLNLKVDRMLCYLNKLESLKLEICPYGKLWCHRVAWALYTKYLYIFTQNTYFVYKASQNEPYPLVQQLSNSVINNNPHCDPFKLWSISHYLEYITCIPGNVINRIYLCKQLSPHSIHNWQRSYLTLKSYSLSIFA